MPDRFDVAVVGAGPAGSAAAFQLASAGLSVVIVERKSFPRDKVCGDVLTPRALRALARIGLAEIPREHFRVDGVRFENGHRRHVWRFDTEPPPFGYGRVIARTTLDDRLRKAAQDAGATLWDDAPASELLTTRSGRVVGLAVDRSDGRRDVEAGLIILSDGTTGLLSRRLREASSGRSDQPGFALRQYVEGLRGLDAFVEFHLPLTWGGRRLTGYGWICPLSATTANVGAGFLQEEVTEATSLIAVFQEYLYELRMRDLRFANARPLGEPKGGIIRATMVDPFSMPRGVLVTGDAAGLANPYIGEGIGYALESAELASRSAIAMLRPGTHRQLYARELVRSFPQQWALRGVARHHRWVGSGEILYQRGQSSHGIVAAVANFVLDRSPSPDPTFQALTISPAGRRIVRLLTETRRTIVERVRRIDRVAAEVLMRLPWSRSRALLPILAAGGLASPQRRGDPVARNAILAVATFALADVVHDDVQEGPAASTHAANSLAIVIGDCLLGEASIALAELPRLSHQKLVAALRGAAEARRSPLPRSGLRSAAAHRYDLLAAPTIELVSILASDASRSSTRSLALWLATTFLATIDLENELGSETASYLEDQLGMMPKDSLGSSAGITAWLTARARAALVTSRKPSLSKRSR